MIIWKPCDIDVHFFYLDDVWQQAIAWIKVDPDLCRRMTSYNISRIDLETFYTDREY